MTIDIPVSEQQDVIFKPIKDIDFCIEALHDSVMMSSWSLQRDTDASVVFYLRELKRLRTAQPKGDALVAVLQECEEYFDQRADVNDGSYGEPVPNQEMALLSLIRHAIAGELSVAAPSAQPKGDDDLSLAGFEVGDGGLAYRSRSQPKGESAENHFRIELENIAYAKPHEWEPDVRDQFQQWAQNRARNALLSADAAAALRPPAACAASQETAGKIPKLDALDEAEITDFISTTPALRLDESKAQMTEAEREALESSIEYWTDNHRGTADALRSLAKRLGEK